jgi:predicted ATPase
MIATEKHTNRRNIFVITGGASCGKSTIIDALRIRGKTVLEEIARKVLIEREGYEATKEEWHYRQTEIHKRQLAQEDGITNGIAFSDRSLVDGIAYCKHLLNYIPEENKEPELKGRYNAVLVLDRLPLKKDGTRIEKDDKEAELIHNLILNEYIRLGYSPISVPVFPGSLEESVAARVDFILKKTEADKWIY